jgi:hypothetical protein
MPNLTRTTDRSGTTPATTSAAASSTRILLVRQPVKSVRASEEPNRAALHLAIGVISALGAVGLVWLMGYLGFRMGFAPVMRVPDLLAEPGNGLVTGTMILISVPQVILQAGLSQPGFLMLAFAMIAIPAASLGAIAPSTPGGPRPSREAVIVSYAGAIAAALNGVALLTWTVSPFRSSFVTELPFSPPTPEHPNVVQHWIEDLQTLAGLDVLAVISAALWVVVIMRLVIPLWLRVLTASMCFFSLCVVLVAMSMSGAAAAQIASERSLIFIDDGSLDPRLLLGSTRQSMAVLMIDDQATLVELRDRPANLTVVGRQSIVDFLESRATKRP